MSYLPPSEYLLWKHALRDGQADLTIARTVGRTAGAHSRLLGGTPGAARRNSPPTRSFSTFGWSPTCWPPLDATPTWRRHWSDWSRRRKGTRSRWCTAMSARRTSSSARRGRCCSTPNAPGGATLRSISRSASTTCCSSACGMRRPRMRSSRPSTRCRLRTCMQWIGSRATDVERRAAALLPGLFLARVDGKSPVEYITDDAQRDPVRRVAGALLQPPGRSAAIGRHRLARGTWTMNDEPSGPYTRGACGTAAAGRRSRRK